MPHLSLGRDPNPSPISVSDFLLSLLCRGVIVLENETYGLEPVMQSDTNDHLLYLLKDEQTEPLTCGVVSEAASEPSHEPFEPGQSLTSLLRVGCSVFLT